jgi:hypothetical protein
MLRNTIIALVIAAVGTVAIAKTNFAPSDNDNVAITAANQLPIEYIEMDPLHITASEGLTTAAACGDDANCDFISMEPMVITASPTGDTTTTVACANGGVEC